ncbi:hypothetical protein RB600_009163 [Gaeumannomyces tritici]
MPWLPNITFAFRRHYSRLYPYQTLPLPPDPFSPPLNTFKMRFSVAAVSAALFGAALAAPALQANAGATETLVIQKFVSTSKDATTGSPVVSISFQLISHREAGIKAYVCEAHNPNGITPADSNLCAGFESFDGYHFQYLDTKTGNTSLRVFHQTAPAFGLWGNAFIPGNCGIEGDAQVCRKDSVNVSLALN